MTLAPVQTLFGPNDPAMAHQGMAEMLAACTGPASCFVIVYEPGGKPSLRYYGRSLTETETRGVLATVLSDVCK